MGGDEMRRMKSYKFSPETLRIITNMAERLNVSNTYALETIIKHYESEDKLREAQRFSLTHQINQLKRKIKNIDNKCQLI